MRRTICDFADMSRDESLREADCVGVNRRSLKGSRFLCRNI